MYEKMLVLYAYAFLFIIPVTLHEIHASDWPSMETKRTKVVHSDILHLNRNSANRISKRSYRTELMKKWTSAAPHLQCKIFDNTTLDCFNRHLSSIPTLPQEQIYKIVLSRNNLTRVLNPTFVKHPNIEALYLDSNQISLIERLAFAGLYNLTTLFLQYNRLTNLLPDVFINLKQLETLDLSDNQLDRTPQEILSHLTQLRKFVYSQSSNASPIFTTENVATPLMNLEEIFLHQFIDTQELGAFKTLKLTNDSLSKSPNLRKLTILNDVHAERDTFKTLKYLESLKVLCMSSFDLFSSFSTSLQVIYNECKIPLHTSLKVASTTSLQPLHKFKHLQTLQLTHFISSIEDDAFSWAENLITLILRGNGIKHISAGAFNGLANLQGLSLAFNELVSVPSEAFQVFNPSIPLNWLDLSCNNIKYIPENFSHPFGASKTLESINLKCNKLTNEFFNVNFSMYNPIRLLVDKNEFETSIPHVMNRFPNLQTLSAGSNTFSEIPPPGLMSSNLTTLKLENFPILLSPSDVKFVIIAFSSIQHDMPFLETLEISISDLCTAGLLLGFLGNTTHLKSFSLTDSCFTSGDLEDIYIGPFQNLEKLVLARNQLTFLPQDMFTVSPNIEILDLSDNAISKIDASAMRVLHKLQNLNLWNNKLLDISFVEFIMPTLQHLNLGKNSIQQIPTSLFKNAVNLQTLDLSGNPFACTCNSGILYFVTWFSINKVTQIEFKENQNYMCETPANMKGIVITQVDLHCPSILPMILGVIAAVTIVLSVFIVFSIKYYWRIRLGLFQLRHGRRLPDYIDDNDLDNLMEEHNNGVLPARQQGAEGARPRHFDAYVAYHKNDENWVLDEMIKEMEGEYLTEDGEVVHNEEQQQWMRLYIPERDMQPGLNKMRLASDAIERSTASIIVLSQMFLDDEWCKFQMRIAMAMLFDRNRDVVILVLLEDVPYENLTHELRELLRWKRYLVWPDDPHGQRLFWQRLRAKIHKRACVNRQHER